PGISPPIGGRVLGQSPSRRPIAAPPRATRARALVSQEVVHSGLPRGEWGCSTTPNPQRRSRVTIHPNARLTPAARRLLVHRVRSQGWLVKDAAEAAGVSRRTAHKWLKRFEEAGEAGLLDRSSRPLSSP